MIYGGDYVTVCGIGMVGGNRSISVVMVVLVLGNALRERSGHTQSTMPHSGHGADLSQASASSPSLIISWT